MATAQCGQCEDATSGLDALRHALRAGDGASETGLTPESFEFQVLLGRGAFASVYRVVHQDSGDVFAMKILDKPKYIRKQMLHNAVSERQVLASISHPFVAGLSHAFQTESSLVMLLQHCPGGSLSALIHRERRLPEELARLYTAEICLALEHLHEHGIVHRDVKAANVVLDADRHAMLTDFGLAKSNVFDAKALSGFAGTACYVAPEIIKCQGHGCPVDVYNLGLLLFEMLTGRVPFFTRHRQELFCNICNTELHIPGRVSETAGRFIRSATAKNPAARPTASAMRGHGFLKRLDVQDVLQRRIAVPELPRKLFRAKHCKSRAFTGQNPLKKSSEALEPQVPAPEVSEPEQVPEWDYADSAYELHCKGSLSGFSTCASLDDSSVLLQPHRSAKEHSSSWDSLLQAPPCSRLPRIEEPERRSRCWDCFARQFGRGG